MISDGWRQSPSKTIREKITSSVDIIIQAARMRDGTRKITHVTEVLGLEGEVMTLQDLFVYDVIGEDANGRIDGRYRSTGIARPYFYERARYYGEDKRLTEILSAGEVQDEHGRPWENTLLTLSWFNWRSSRWRPVRRRHRLRAGDAVSQRRTQSE